MNGKVLLAVSFALILSVSLQPVPVWADDDAIMDQDNPYFISLLGNWSVSSWAPCATGGGYYFAWGSDDSITYETYETADITGEYAVYARWTSHPNRNDNARYRIYDGASTLRSTVNVDQREDGCNWQWLDTVILTNGNMGRVILDNPGATASEATVADGVRFVRITKDGDDIQDGSITTADIMNGTVTSADVGFNYAASVSKGGPALDLTCSSCVSLGELNFTPGDITGVGAGTGLTGGGLSGNVTLNADTNYLQRRVGGTCPPGSSIRVISSTGTVTCELDSIGGADSDWTVAGNNMYSAVSGNVGIGKTSPSHKLHLGGMNDSLRLEGTGGFGSLARINFGDADYVYIEEDIDDRLTIYSLGRTAIMGGDVGIGTTTPPERLSVQGSAWQNLTSNGFIKGWARIRADGTIASCYNCNTSTSETRRLSTGNYEVDFTPISTSIAGRPRSATLDTLGTGSAVGMISVADRAGDVSSVFVATTDATGSSADRAFSLIIY